MSRFNDFKSPWHTGGDCSWQYANPDHASCINCRRNNGVNNRRSGSGWGAVLRDWLLGCRPDGSSGCRNPLRPPDPCDT